MSEQVNKQNILIVDDRPENLLALESILEDAQKNIVKANSGQEALWKLLQNEFSLVLLDVQMPGMDGFETAELIRKNHETKDIPIIFVTAVRKERKNVFRGYESGTVDYLFKPVEEDILKSKVKVFCELDRQKKIIEKQKLEMRDDIAELKRMKNLLLDQSNHDSLTGLANRRLFYNLLDQTLNISERDSLLFALLYLDLDRFKKVNGAYGHDAGDVLLAEAARRLNGCTRKSDIVARMGGDEFAILLHNISSEQDAVQTADSINRSFLKPFYLNGDIECHLGVSIGICLYPFDGDQVDSLMRNADAAMYSAKKSQGVFFQFYSRELNIQIIEQTAIQKDLEKALREDEFLLYYQPQVDIKTGRITCLEALVRWQHPKKGLLLPGEFLSVAKETGLLIKMDEWVIRAACNQIKVWREAGFPIPRIAVNMSDYGLKQQYILDLIEKVIKETGVPAECLELEHTEDIFMQNPELMIKELIKLNNKGVRISIDDFGTGYSSLSYLKLLPIYKLKIDRSFIRNLTTDPDDVSIVKAIITMGHSLNLKILAEGVETREQHELLRQLQCDEIQGYLISKPAPLSKLIRFWN